MHAFLYPGRILVKVMEALGLFCATRAISRRSKRTTMLLIAFVTIALASIEFGNPAHAGCGDAEGKVHVCFKGNCEVHKLVRHCSSVMAGNHWVTDEGYRFGYSRPIGNRWTMLEVRYLPYQQILYSGDPDQSPYDFEVCSESRFIAEPCSEKAWAK